MTHHSPAHRTAHGAARIQALTETAAKLFLDRGYEAVSLDDLIGRVGGSRRNIYAHFGGKQGLFIEVVTQLCDELADPLRRLDITEDTAEAALNVFGRHVLEIVLQPRALALHRLMIAEGQRFPELAQAVLHAGHNNAIRILAAWMELRRANFRSDRLPEVLAAQFLDLLVSGPQQRTLVGIEPARLHPEQIARLVEDAVSTFLDGSSSKPKVPHA